MKRKYKFTKLIAPLLCTTLLFACSNTEEESSSGTSTATEVNIESLSTLADSDIQSVVSGLVSYSDDDFYTEWENEDFTSIQLNGSTATYEGSGAVVVSGSTVTIKTGGVYVLSGTLDDGQIVVDAEDNNTVRLVLNGVDITSSSSAPIYVKNAEKAVLSMPEGTENTVTDGTQYVYDDTEAEEPNSTIFSKGNLTINGEGNLVVEANFNNGITGKDDLKITGGNIEVTAKDDGIVGRDLLAIKEGTFTITAGGDGMKTTNDEDAEKGNLVIEAGTYSITAENDGIQAQTSLYTLGGDYTITTGGGSPETVAANENAMGGRGQSESTTTTTTTETSSSKGLKATAELAIAGGTFDIDSLDDAVHSNGNVLIEAGEFTIATGDDGIHADSSVLTKGGNITVTKSYEGIEGSVIAIADGTIDVTASDDGVNVGGGVDGSGMDMESSASSDQLLQISGGYVSVNSQGDGLDSNGNFVMTGGTAVVSGPTNSGNGSLDYNGTFEISGGLLIAAGSSGMVQASSDTSEQNGILMTYPATQSAGTLIHLEDSEGNTIATFAPEKEYSSVYISSPDLVKDSSYTLYSGGTSTGTETNGLYTDGEYSGGTKVVEFTISDVVTWLNESGVTEAQSGMGGMGGHGGGGMRGDGGTPPEGMERPDRGTAPGTDSGTTDQSTTTGDSL
ncbi:carbohydrate-binding domain-containing protein [Robertmurraya korlensis]|uniref:carbohydrate-binding domain-containing protein n=1 Tax=Robertmurraya korlensis TaxID=519977 RepID=UPI0020425D0C|nr:carbohydrate-binding domain-containing protein [Robertmurraya korlensis]MCM3603030.1 carbohydrate-binding domain-containing protein [Robertmurraya korlensis]